MSSWAAWFGGKRAPPTRDATRDTIVELRQHLLTMEKKEDFLNKKIEEETQKAKNALLQGGSNGKRIATASIKQKKTHEGELEKLYGMRSTIEAQVSVLIYHIYDSVVPYRLLPADGYGLHRHLLLDCR